jgi:hypothetical protein
MGETQPGNPRGVLTLDLFSVKENATLIRFQHPRDGSHGGGFAGSVGADQGYYLALCHLQRCTRQYLAGTISGIEIFND